MNPPALFGFVLLALVFLSPLVLLALASPDLPALFSQHHNISKRYNFQILLEHN